MTPIPQQVKRDLDYILRETVATAANTLDELTLLRAATRRYMETGDAEGAVAWAAGRLSDSLTSISST
jgi:hypothetical protein